MFVGRENEIQFLENCLKSNKFEMIPIYGRRRVGKTRLIEEFIRDKKFIFYTAEQRSESSNLKGLSEAVYSGLFRQIGSVSYPSFDAVFDAIAQYAEQSEENIIFVIDEYPYLAQTSAGIASILQRAIDRKFLTIPNLMLILTGSQTSFMERQVLGYQSPLYGRRTGQIKLKSLTFSEARHFLPNTPINDFLTLYGITGGIPLYLSMMSDDLSLADNIKQKVLAQNTFLYEEPRNLLLQELRNPNRYNDILTAIARGVNKFNEISDKTEIESGNLTKYLATLIELDLIQKQTPIPKKSKQKGIYTITDGLFNFWYRYVPAYQSFILSGKLEQIWPRIELDLVQFTSFTFEEYCRHWLHLNSKMLLSEVGSWWGNNPLITDASASAVEIDIVALGIEKDELALGECKWRNELTGLSVGEKLLERASFFPHKKIDLYIFSKADFTEDLKEFAIDHGIRLLKFEDIAV